MRAPGLSQDTGAVFTTGNGLPVDPARMTRDFMAIRKVAGVRSRTLHVLRHGAVSLMLAAGMDPPTSSKGAGHKRYPISVDTYRHLIAQGGTAKAKAKAVDAFLARNTATQAAAGKGGRRAISPGAAVRSRKPTASGRALWIGVAW